MLTIAARTISGTANAEMIKELDRELTEVIEDFDHAVGIEALRLANETSKLSFSQSVDSQSSWVCCRVSRARASGKRASRARASRSRVFV